jgi:hypothetical protein
MTKDTGGYAFPHVIEHLHEPVTAGMTLRDYFAAKAIIAYHADGNYSSPEDVANWCYSLADAMLEARE